MFSSLKTNFKYFDWLLLAAVLLLTSFGLMEIYSISLGQGASSLLNFKKQIVFISLGVVALLALSFIDFKIWKNTHRYLYIIAIVLLVLVLGLGQEIKGTKGWFSIAGFGIQPVELVKLFLIIFLARIFANPAAKTRPRRYFLLSGLAALFLAGLVMLQPDFGSAVMLMATWGFMSLFFGFKKKYFIWLLVLAGILFVIAWGFLFKDYQRQRILTVLNPGANSLGQGYNVSQAMIAVGSGRFLGRGIGFGSQSQLKFLPEVQTDFIFAAIAEELGFIGILLFFAFYFLIFFRLLKAVRLAKDDFAVFVLLGVSSLLFLEMFINIGMNIGVFPVVGIALPFVSYGGSSILASFMAIGLAENIIIRSRV